MYGGVFNVVDVEGFLDRVGGTSESAPLFAGVIARLNEVSLALANKPLGFVNPLLYQMAAATASLPAGQRAFNDIVIGDNVCPQLTGVTNPVLKAKLSVANCKQVCSGFYAAPGWDPVSHTRTTHGYAGGCTMLHERTLTRCSARCMSLLCGGR